MMSTPIQPVTRAVLMLDQSSGELREEDGQLLGLDLWPEVRSVIGATQLTQLEVVLAVPTDLDANAVRGLSGWMEGLTVAPISSETTFSQAGEKFLGLSDMEPFTAFVSADRRLRGEAAKAGMQPASHAALLPIMMRGQIPDAVCLVGAKETLARLALHEDVIPMHFQATTGMRWCLIGLVTDEILADAAIRGVELHPLDYDHMTHDLLWVRIDEDNPEARQALTSRKILHADFGQILLSLAPDDDTEALNVHGAHGHSELLFPSPNLLRPAICESLGGDVLDSESLPENIFEPVPEPVSHAEILRLLGPVCHSVRAKYENDLNRYCGATAPDPSGPIVSRHTAHPGNKRAESQLLYDLRGMGYTAYRHNFTHAGQTLSNIIADLPGVGLFRIRPDVLDRYRRILRETPLPTPLAPFEADMQGLVEACMANARRADNGSSDGIRDTDINDASASARDGEPEQITDSELRYGIENVFHLQPWYPWWKPGVSIPNYGADLVIVGGHLDSTAGFEPGYVAATDPAPGCDDNGSGLAGVLSLARSLARFRGKLTHTIRFCFFNAEESGLVGSKAYAAKMKSLGAPIRASICIDMIGYNSDINRIFEVHAGYTDPSIRDLNLPLASEVADSAATYGRLAPAQVYSGTSWSGAPDRTVYDGAINRSDHAAFHQQGYSAVLVSEDFFANLPSEPGADPNPNYHRAADDSVDLNYAQDIVCAIARTVINLAR